MASASHCTANLCDYFKRRIFLISWISLVIYLFYDSFIFYKNGQQFYYLREMLGVGLCVSRGTAAVLNLCCALVLLPLCKKLNQVLYQILSKLWPALFFFWLEKAKSFHMTVAITLLVFSVIHSISHFGNLWNFSRGYDEERIDINFAAYKDENPFRLLMSQAGLTGVSMLMITLTMGLTSLRAVRRRIYNAFWYTHQLYLPFMVLLIIHPMSGALKEEILEENSTSPNPSQEDDWNENFTISSNPPRFVAIKSKTWLWMSVPLTCFFLDLLWRIFSRNRARVEIIDVTHMPGRTVSLTMSHTSFRCRLGQYVLLQCADTSLLEWHPFTVVRVPTSSQKNFVVWIRVRGDWTKALEKLLVQNEPHRVRLLLDGPFSSPMEGVGGSGVAICVAAGVGITPFVAVLQHMLMNPRSNLPGRIHLLWIVRHESEITWLADLADQCLHQLREANRPDRLHLLLYVTGGNCSKYVQNVNIVVNENGGSRLLREQDDKASLLTPGITRKNRYEGAVCDRVDDNYDVAKEYPVLGCRVRRGRPHWDRNFGYWVHLYPGEDLNLYCCGPKKLVKLLRSKCKNTSCNTKTKFTFVHEGFS